MSMKDMKVAFITRSTLYSIPGGDTVQVLETARHLESMGVSAEVKLSNETVDYKQYDLLHFFNLTRPADILFHSKKAQKPFVVSTILCNYNEYDKNHRKGFLSLFSFLPADGVEYLKTIARWLKGGDTLTSKEYLWKGQRSSIIKILKTARMILPNSASEYKRITQTYTSGANYSIIPNGVNTHLFQRNFAQGKDNNLILCVARIEGIKNQLNLIKALNNTQFRLLIIGSHAPNQKSYYDECLNTAAPNVTFINHVSQQELVKYYQQAKVHVLPSWFETTGLSSLEAAVMGCNIVITDKGDAKEYFGANAFYCNPADPKSILEAVEKAGRSPYNEDLHEIITKRYTWKQAAIQTYKAYQAITI